MKIYCKRSIIIILLLLVLRPISTTDYCKLCKKGIHTLCRYKEGPSDSCIEYKKPEFSSSVKKYIVDIHNDIRNHIASGHETRGALGRQPAASNMNSLQWDNELAEIAQRWADQCIGLKDAIQHDQCRKTGRFEVGQNVLTAITPTLNLPEIAILILNWYKQVENVLPSDVETFSGIQRGKYLIGQYTQLVWAETRYVGCGMASFRNRNMSDTRAKYLHRLVCNYAPRGNVIGSSVYSRGVPCSKCPYGRCDPVRTSICQVSEESHNPSGKYDGRASSKEKSAFHIDMPASLFNTLNLAYILKNNLTEVINNIMQKVKVHLVPDEKKYDKNKQEHLSLNQVLAVLASVMPNLDRNELEKEFQNTERMYSDPIDYDFWKNASKKTSNILFSHYSFDGIQRRNIYDLENGQVIVDDCRDNLQHCQYEDEEATANVPPQGDIVLPNNMIYRKIEGVWFHGRCRCNYVYRSSASIVQYSLLVIVPSMIMTKVMTPT